MVEEGRGDHGDALPRGLIAASIMPQPRRSPSRITQQSQRAPTAGSTLVNSTIPGLKGDVHEWQPRPGGWQTLQLEQDIWEDEDLSILVERRRNAWNSSGSVTFI
ncbi:hypothetical protein [Streptomyces sp. NPDC048266]|uniref:hypothetical protein n=1 Tax=Streptomyces sp. NPDC048266 TaxID=3155787 RepID=UPI0033CAC7C8